MTVLEVVQRAATVLGIEIPSQVFPDTRRTMVEMKAAVNRAALQISRDHDWTMLREIHTIAENGSEFPLPSDYDRMVRDAEIVGMTWGHWPLKHINSLNDWILLKENLAQTWSTYGYWTAYGGRIHVMPPSGAPFSFGYITNNIVSAVNSGLPKERFTLDSDSFRLSEYLLELALIWNWKAAKGDDYAEEMAAYQIALAEEISKDRGSGIVRTGRSGIRGARPSYSNRVRW